MPMLHTTTKRSKHAAAGARRAPVTTSPRTVALTTSPINWGALRAQFVATDERVPSLRAFAEERDVPYSTLCKRAADEGWRKMREIHGARQRLRRDAERLEFQRKQSTLAAKHVIRILAKKKMPLEQLASELCLADSAIGYAWTAVHHFAASKNDLDELLAGRERPIVSPIKENHDCRGPGSWPSCEENQSTRHLGRRTKEEGERLVAEHEAAIAKIRAEVSP